MSYDSTKPAGSDPIGSSDEYIRENFRALLEDAIVIAGKLNGFIQGNASGNIPLSNGTVCTNLNADKLDGQDGSYYVNATNIATGTLADTRLSATVTKLGNTVNSANGLIQLNSSNQLPALDGSLLTNLPSAIKLDLSNTPFATSGLYVTTYVNGTSWYREYFSDAAKTTRVWLEQGGQITGTTNTPVAFVKNFSNTNYTFVYGQGGVDANYDAGADIIRYDTKTISGIQVYRYAGSTHLSGWYACGV